MNEDADETGTEQELEGAIHMKNNISPETTAINSARTASKRPDLLVRPQLTPVSEADRFSGYGILSQLDPQSAGGSSKFGSGRAGLSTGSRKPGKKWLLVSACVAVIALAGLLFTQLGPNRAADLPATELTSQAALPAKTITDASLNRSGAAPALIAENTLAAPLDVPVVVASQAAAQIITEPAPVPNTAALDTATRQNRVSAALEAGVQPAPATLQKALNSKPAAAPKTTAAADTTVRRADAAKKSPAETRGSEIATADKDVSLLAAVIAHDKNDSSASVASARKAAVNSRPSTQAATRARFEPSKSAALSSDKTTRTGLANRDTATGANRDIVARNAAEPTDSLLKRCSALGFVESQLCRLRICSGQWETDMACKASLSSNAAAAGPVVAETANLQGLPVISAPVR